MLTACVMPRHYCTAGQKFLCPGGVFGNSTGLSVSTCTQPCDAGRYGATPGQTTASCEGECAPGYACPQGSSSATQQACPAGRYSSTPASTCLGVCPEGFYCPVATSEDTIQDCGTAAFYCPAGSGTPTSVTTGHYSTPNTTTTAPRTAQAICSHGTCSRCWLVLCVCGNGHGVTRRCSLVALVLQGTTALLALPFNARQAGLVPPPALRPACAAGTVPRVATALPLAPSPACATASVHRGTYVTPVAPAPLLLCVVTPACTAPAGRPYRRSRARATTPPAECHRPRAQGRPSVRLVTTVSMECEPNAQPVDTATPKACSRHDAPPDVLLGTPVLPAVSPLGTTRRSKSVVALRCTARKGVPAPGWWTQGTTPAEVSHLNAQRTKASASLGMLRGRVCAASPGCVKVACSHVRRVQVLLRCWRASTMPKRHLRLRLWPGVVCMLWSV